MEIKYFGLSSFYIKSKTARIITDPFSSTVGMKLPKTEADIVIVSHSHEDHNNTGAIEGNPLVIDMPGEFEKNDARIFGYSSYHDKKGGKEKGENIIYKIETEGVTILHLGDLGHVPDSSFVDNVGKIDILMIPVGGVHTLDASEALDVVKKIEPSIVIPMHYNMPKLNQEKFGDIAPVDNFLKEIGAEGTAPLPKLTVKKEDLGEEMKVVVLEI